MSHPEVAGQEEIESAASPLPLRSLKQPGWIPESLVIVGATLFNAALAATLLLIAGGGSDGTELALRTTARVSFVWFILTFVASPLEELRPSPFTAWLMRYRRAFGVVFGLSMSIHVGFILRLFALHAPARPPMVTDADFFVGIPGLVVVAVLTITSLDILRDKLGPIGWRRLHLTGIWFVWFIFISCLIDSVRRKTTNHPVLAYYAFIAVLAAAAVLRLLAMRKRRGAYSPLGPNATLPGAG